MNPQLAVAKSYVAKNGVWPFLIAALCFLVLAGLHTSQLGYEIENYGARRLEFYAREALGFAPVLDPRIKIFAYDRATLHGLETDDLDIDQWGKMLAAINEQKPRVILVDKVFRTPRALHRSEAFNQTMAGVTTRVVAGAYVEAANSKSPNVVTPQASDFDLEKLSHDDKSGGSFELPWMATEPGTIIGPHERIRAGLKTIGHVVLERNSFVKPFLRVERNWGVPHWSLFAAEAVVLGNDGLLVNNHKVGLDRNNLIIPNLMSARYLTGKTHQVLSLAYLAINNLPVKGIDSGDTVVILPAMYPGSEDYVDTPLERMPSGDLMVALVNSVVTGNWLQPSGGGLPALACMCALGLFLALTLRPLFFTLALLGAAAFAIGSGLACFTVFGMVIPWLFPTFGLVLTGACVFAERARINERRLHSLGAMLHGRIAEDRMTQILKDPSILKAKPQGKIVSIMFIDIVGFSQLAEQQTPEAAFTSLKALFETLRSIVLRHNGVVDKTQGDGMLCYFGYGPDGRESSREHADEALACGIEIQETILQRNLKSNERGIPIYPLRIGINTSAVFVGNIGDADHFDYTMIGNGVNLAKRLESACQHYCIMIGSTTYDTLLRRDDLKARLTKRLIPIKHAETPYESYECDPFFDQQTAINTANAAYRKAFNINRKEARWSVPGEFKITVHTNFGPGRVANFSSSGLGVILEKYVGNGIEITFKLTQENLTSPLTSITFVADVRWGRPIEGGFLHGIHVKNLSQEQRDQMLSLFRSLIRTQAEETSPSFAA